MKLGVQIHITEMDVELPVAADVCEVIHPHDFERQAEIYREIAAICLQHRGCTALQTWGFTDKYSWLGWFTHGSEQDGLLFDRQYRPKPAYKAFRRALAAGKGQ